MKRLNTNAVHPESGMAWYPIVPDNVTPAQASTNRQHHVRIVESIAHTKKMACQDQEQVMTLGVVIGYKTPDNGSVNGLTAQSKSGAALLSNPTKRIKTGVHQLSSKCKIMQLADCMEGQSLVFALVLAGPTSLFASVGSINAGYDIKLGDILGVYEPKTTTRTLGSTIPIYESWNRIILFQRNVTLPEKPIAMSSQANQQVNFFKSGVSISFFLVRLLVGNHVKCYGVTCDRQDPSCNGCHTGRAVRRNLVLAALVQIDNQPQYDPDNGVAAFHFRSYTLTELLVDLASLANDDYEQLRSHDNAIRAAARNIAAHVNQHGGWTVYGWHRRGVVNAIEDNVYDLAANTEGHLVRIEPTNQNPEFLDHVRGLRFRCV